MNTPNPAIVSQRAVRRLPRVALLLFCTAYIVPGVFGRDPWKNADLSAFGAMVNVAEGRGDWVLPSVGGIASEIAPLPYALGALFIRALSPWVDPALAARIPFALLLAAVLALTWYASFHLARSDAAKPLPFAFGGEADPIDYARAIADGALLGVIATLGLLQLGHETTPELVQLAAVALYMYGLASSPWRQTQARIAVLAALPALAMSGAPSVSIALAAVGLAVSYRSSHANVRRLVPWIAAAGLAAALLGVGLHAWAWRVGRYAVAADVATLLRLLLWFVWPTWPLALWTLWRWRGHLFHRHIAVPLGIAGVGFIACIVMGGSDRALMLATPAVAALAAFALPTLRRSLSAAIDWFSVSFFTIAVLAIWVIYAALLTGFPASTARNVSRLLPGFVPSFSAGAVALGAAGTLAWLWLVKWRTGRHQHALWKSLVLPASGVALCWLLAMTLWLPLLDYARSLRPLVQRIAAHVPAESCVLAPGLSSAQRAALEYFGRYRVEGAPNSEAVACGFLLIAEPPGSRPTVPDGWRFVARVQRPTDRDDVMAIYRRGSDG